MKIDRRRFWAALGLGPAVGVDVTVHGDSIRCQIPRRQLVAVTDCRNDRDRVIPGTKVRINGEEPRDCFRAEVYNDGIGTVWCYRRNAQGKFFFNGPNLAVSIYHGKVDIIAPPNIKPEVWAAIQKKWTMARAA